MLNLGNNYYVNQSEIAAIYPEDGQYRLVLKQGPSFLITQEQFEIIEDAQAKNENVCRDILERLDRHARL